MNILLINACVRKESRTRRLADAVIDRLNRACNCAPEISGEAVTYEGLEAGACASVPVIQECDLQKENIQPLNAETLARRDSLIAAGDYTHEMFRYARQLKDADVIVVAAPFWDMSFPASLKNYIEQTMVTGLVFRYDDHGMPVSLCKAQQMIYVSTAGGPVFPPHHGYEYVKMISEYFWGAKKNCLIQAENLDVIGADVEAILREKLNEIAGMDL